MPIVATVRIRRGALKNRRTKIISTSAPSTADARSPSGSASQMLHPFDRIRSSASSAGTIPRSACAKLMMRLAR